MHMLIIIKLAYCSTQLNKGRQPNMANEKNFDVLDAYSDGWAKGDSAKIYNYFSDSFTFSGMPNVAPVDKVSFKMFWVTLRSKIEDMGGPAAVSGQFMDLNNTILREVNYLIIEGKLICFLSWEILLLSLGTGPCLSMGGVHTCMLPGRVRLSGMR